MLDPNLSSFIWSFAGRLRGACKQSEYGTVILPFTVLLRLDRVLEKTKLGILAKNTLREDAGLPPEPSVLQKSGQLVCTTTFPLS